MDTPDRSAKKNTMATKANLEQVNELLIQALETEIGGEKIYETAISCAVNADLKEEWQGYLEETRHHQQVLLEAFRKLDLDPGSRCADPGPRRRGPSGPIAGQGHGNASKPEAAQLVAGECVVLAETKDHLNWELIQTLSEKLGGKYKTVLKEAQEEVESQEDHHLYHAKGWTRELWIESLGLPAVLPPPRGGQAGGDSHRGGSRRAEPRRLAVNRRDRCQRPLPGAFFVADDSDARRADGDRMRRASKSPFRPAQRPPHSRSLGRRSGQDQLSRLP